MCVRNWNQDKIIKQKLKPKFVINKNESQNADYHAIMVASK